MITCGGSINGATPVHHPFFYRIFPNKNHPAFLGYPITKWKPPWVIHNPHSGHSCRTLWDVQEQGMGQGAKPQVRSGIGPDVCGRHEFIDLFSP